MSPAGGAPRYYSQHGEDALIEAAFDDVRNGYFVEVGCIDGRRASNTLMLEEQGWCGLCVEAHEDYIDLIRRNRPASHVVHCAIGDHDAAEVVFYSNARASLSTLDPSLEPEFRAKYAPWFHGFVEKKVRLRTLSTLFDELRVPHVNVLSIDIEGCDHLAIRGIDLRRHRPDLIIAEAHMGEIGREIDALLLAGGYHKGPVIQGNSFHFREAERLEKVRGRTFSGVLTLTHHPMDDVPDDLVKFRFVA